MIKGGTDLVVVDIRSGSDFRAGAIKGSIHIPFVELDSRLGEISKGKKVVVADMHGKQVRTAGRFLVSKGFSDVSRLDGGVVSGWLKAGLPLEK